MIVNIQYGSKVLIRDQSELDGSRGIVIKITEPDIAEVLLDKEIIWVVQLEKLELVSNP